MWCTGRVCVGGRFRWRAGGFEAAAEGKGGAGAGPQERPRRSVTILVVVDLVGVLAVAVVAVGGGRCGGGCAHGSGSTTAVHWLEKGSGRKGWWSSSGGRRYMKVALYPLSSDASASVAAAGRASGDGTTSPPTFSDERAAVKQASRAKYTTLVVGIKPTVGGSCLPAAFSLLTRTSPDRSLPFPALSLSRAPYQPSRYEPLPFPSGR